MMIAMYAALSVVRRLLLLFTPAAQVGPRTSEAGHLVKDPVCGTFVAASTEFQKVKDGKTYYFCSAACRDKFKTVG